MREGQETHGVGDNLDALFNKARQEAISGNGKVAEGELPPNFNNVLMQFKSELYKLLYNKVNPVEAADNAIECLHEIVFLDGVLTGSQRKSVATQLFSAAAIASSCDQNRSELERLFGSAPVYDYFLATKYAWESANQPVEAGSTGNDGSLDIVSLHSVKGGTGKSFLARAFAYALCEGGKKVAVVDLDFTGPSFQFMPPNNGVIIHKDPFPAFPIFFKGNEILSSDIWKKLDIALDTNCPDQDNWNDNLRQIASQVGDIEVEKILDLGLEPEPESRQPSKSNNDKVWSELLDRCLMKEENKDIGWVCLPHRPEFLRQAGRLLEAPNYHNRKLINNWLSWLLGKLQHKPYDYDVVIFDNAPGISNTWVIMNEVRNYAADPSTSTNAYVCLVSSRQLSDLPNSAYELLWIQAAAWGGTGDGCGTARTYWLHNMWCEGNDGQAEALQDIKTDWENGKVVPLRFPNFCQYTPPETRSNQAVQSALTLAGLRAEDEYRITTVLEARVKSKAIEIVKIPFKLKLRSSFDFKATGIQPDAVSCLGEEISDLEPVSSILDNGSGRDGPA